MADIDYALAYDFIDPAEGMARQLRFRRNWEPPGGPGVFGGTGQLVAVIAHAGHPATPCPSAAPMSTSMKSRRFSTDGKAGPHPAPTPPTWP